MKNFEMRNVPENLEQIILALKNDIKQYLETKRGEAPFYSSAVLENRERIVKELTEFLDGVARENALDTSVEVIGTLRNFRDKIVQSYLDMITKYFEPSSPERLKGLIDSSIDRIQAFIKMQARAQREKIVVLEASVSEKDEKIQSLEKSVTEHKEKIGGLEEEARKQRQNIDALVDKVKELALQVSDLQQKSVAQQEQQRRPGNGVRTFFSRR